MIGLLEDAGWLGNTRAHGQRGAVNFMESYEEAQSTSNPVTWFMQCNVVRRPAMARGATEKAFEGAYALLWLIKDLWLERWGESIWIKW